MAITNSDLTAFIDSNVDYGGIVANQYTNNRRAKSFLQTKIGELASSKVANDAELEALEERIEAQKYGARKGVQGALWGAIGNVAGAGMQVGIDQYLSSGQRGIDHNAIWNRKNSIPFSRPSASYESFSTPSASDESFSIPYSGGIDHNALWNRKNSRPFSRP